jgi:hypothetical protein
MVVVGELVEVVVLDVKSNGSSSLLLLLIPEYILVLISVKLLMSLVAVSSKCSSLVINSLSIKFSTILIAFKQILTVALVAVDKAIFKM